MLHTSDCSERQQQAEIKSKINLFCPSCPRCRLNFAAPQMLAAMKELYSIVEHKKEFTKMKLDSIMSNAKAAINAAEGKE